MCILLHLWPRSSMLLSRIISTTFPKQSFTSTKSSSVCCLQFFVICLAARRSLPPPISPALSISARVATRSSFIFWALVGAVSHPFWLKCLPTRRVALTVSNQPHISLILVYWVLTSALPVITSNLLENSTISKISRLWDAFHSRIRRFMFLTSKILFMISR